MSKYIPTIGLEIHAELKTKTKMFCSCLNETFNIEPNKNTCPICLAHPGTLPVVNKKAVELVLKIGMALQGDIPQFSKFDRKNYFYPDIPKAYQISQYDLPLVFGGVLRGVKLTRIHLEEDTGSLEHGKDKDGKEVSFVDYNRAGVPLMELVTEPDIKNAEQASEFAKELQLTLKYLGASDADMEKGLMRVEANVSLGTIVSGEFKLGTKVEVKNIASFSSVRGAIEYELKRQEEVLESGGKVIQETRGWDASTGTTFSQRSKESAHDYRYFPDPDIPPLDLSKISLKEIKASIPELPGVKRLRFQKEYGLNEEQVNILVQDLALARFFEESVSEIEAEDNINTKKEIQLIYNYLTSDLIGLMSALKIGFSEIKITPENFSDLIEMISHDKVSSRSAKDILKKMEETGEDPHNLLSSLGLEQVSDEGELRLLAHKMLAENPKAIEDFKKGKENALQFLVGRAMGALKGKGNPGILQKIFREELLKL
ncbi:MAG: Asp-tRNA(Asn)/Glu-tRNA(Gln) amidotransferase subunit GatB [Candidatus Pacebacteria bacterium]|nr:Asp-tRNA(Asn)/Glu-tRNA(Gln) amidotransferase subunit GatB [Candidatus Paceibacterota bacterium]